MRMGTARVPCRHAGLLAVPRWGPAGLARIACFRGGLRRPCLRRRWGTFHAAGCGSLQPGTARAFGDRIPVPDGVERPRSRRHVPGRAECTHQHRTPSPHHAARTQPQHPPEPRIHPHPAPHPHQHEGPVAVGLSTNHNRPRARASTCPQPQPSDVRTPRRPPRRARSC